jgi:hypothetical protein
MKFSELLASKNDTDLGALMRDRYTRLMAAHKQGLTDTPPGAQYNADTAVLRAHRAAGEDAAGSGLGARELEEADKPPGPQRNGGALDAMVEFNIRQSGGTNVEGEIAVVRARRADPAKIRGMLDGISGYGRLR